MSRKGRFGNITKEYTVWCAACERGITMPFSTTYAEAEEDAEENGWKYKNGNGWLCPECQGNTAPANAGEKGTITP
jgi:hypothetical protein